MYMYYFLKIFGMGGHCYSKHYASVLGMGLDLTWDKHTSVMCSKATERTGLMLRYM